MTNWMDREGPLSEIVISTRLRLARNFSTYPFPMALNQKSAMMLVEDLENKINELDTVFGHKHELVRLSELNAVEKRILLEKHLVSSDFIKPGLPKALVLNEDQSVSIMINEEDHIRLQCLLSGLQLKQGWEIANRIDDYIDERLPYAFDDRLGYLTSCTTNVGTGLRASVMMHLPALTMTGYIDRIFQVASQMGLAIRGMFGEGSEVLGDMYQISNQVTLGRTENEIMSSLDEVVTQIVEREQAARKQLVDHNPYQIEDKIHRAYGVLVNARVLSSKEALEMLSYVRMGMGLGLIDDLSWNIMNRLLLEIQPAFLQKFYGEELSPFERDVKRAEFVRGILK